MSHSSLKLGQLRLIASQFCRYLIAGHEQHLQFIVGDGGWCKAHSSTACRPHVRLCSCRAEPEWRQLPWYEYHGMSTI